MGQKAVVSGCSASDSSKVDVLVIVSCRGKVFYEVKIRKISPSLLALALILLGRLRVSTVSIKHKEIDIFHIPPC